MKVTHHWLEIEKEKKKYTFSYLTQLTKGIVLIQNSSKTSMFSLFLVEVFKYSKYQMCIVKAKKSYTQMKSRKYKSD